MRYRVVRDTSTRASDDPAAPGFEEWVHFPAGSEARSWPAHAPVAEWVASGAWEELEADAPKRGRKAKEPVNG